MSEPNVRLLPRPTPETAHFWEGTKRGQLLVQRCDSCTHVFFPPRAFCPSCSGSDVNPYPVGGGARLLSYVISARPAPGIEAPYSVAVVQLDEGPTMMTNIVNCEQTPERLVLDMRLQVVFVAQNDDITLPLFEPGVAT